MTPAERLRAAALIMRDAIEQQDYDAALRAKEERRAEAQSQPAEVDSAAPIDAILLTTEAAAARLGLSPHTLRIWRSAGEGPCFVRRGKLVRYRRSDLEVWVDAEFN
ncbi:helix-turn-helix domain-containing protein [Microbacterium sp. B19]|uniref:helix-turn-helix domain-containing protein n=1 Tax=Microbacterium sp. B19 TaxID=96765 RepID=UPI00054D8E1C|nr:helix-turn-helix domain-containing protein [Microbacterium sp. B19]